MKRILALVMAILLLGSAMSFAEDMDLTSFTDDELNGLEQAIATEREARANAAAEAAAAAAQAEAEAAEQPAFEPLRKGEYNENNSTLQQKLKDLGYLTGKVDGIFGPQTEKALMALQADMGLEQTGVVNSAEEFNMILNAATGDGINIAVGTSSEWSDWMTPAYNEQNSCFNIAYAYPGERQVGDAYTCQIEIEFADVTATEGSEDQPFRFWTQGAVDDVWDIGNIWTPDLIQLSEVPSNGVYKFTSISAITDKNLNATKFDLGFRCDYWASGSFRVRNVKVEKGSVATEWSLAPADEGDGVNIAVGTSSEWSEWMTPEANGQNKCFNVAYAYPGERHVGDAYTCQIEIEFVDVTATEGGEDQTFAFWTQGAVDSAWDIGNIWYQSLICLSEVPENGVYKYVSTSRITDKNVAATQFDIGFRCDYWATGSFRVRNIKVEKGTVATDWTPAP